MFAKILIANRGEIACRIARTARELGIATVAVYSEADRDALHVRRCDQAFSVGPAAAAESYLCGQRIIDAALESGAEAIHPGYGFLSENPEFAEACAHAGVEFIGPPPEAIRAMGSKSRAREMMAKAGVAVTPGYHAAQPSAQRLKKAAAQLGYPVLLKAVAGGGGKGMRMVARAGEFDEALASVQREALAAFADDRVLVETYVESARHVEVQVFADRHGNILHLFERDCSIQRRHQKVIEEAPAPGIDEGLREKLTAAAVDAAAAIGYVGAGTVEFLLAPDGAFYFMEMNTRLQVEHPVTEMITGQDLVEWQLRVAAGYPLPCGQAELRMHGHAMESRIYAENPENDFLPATGALAVYRHAPECAWLRVDSGVEQGDRILPHYDPMIAKLVVWGRDRETARRRLASALAGFDIAGVATNLEFLTGLAALDDFVDAALDTRLIERNRTALFAGKGGPPEMCLAIAALFELGAGGGGAGQSQLADSNSPWSPSDAWQLNLPGEAACVFAAGSGEVEYTIRFEGGRQFADMDGGRVPVRLVAPGGGRVQSKRGGRFRFHYGGRVRAVSIDKVGDTIHLNLGGRRYALPVAERMRAGAEPAVADAGLVAPMPGMVIAVYVAENQQVARGAPLLVLEAMKMEHTIRAPRDGIITKLFFRDGAQVREGEQLLEMETTEQA